MTETLSKPNTLAEYEAYVDEWLLSYYHDEGIEHLYLDQFALSMRKEKVALCRALLSMEYDSFALPLTSDGLLLVDPSMQNVKGATFDLPYFIEMMGYLYLFGLKYRSTNLIEQANKMAMASLRFLDGHQQLALAIGAYEGSDLHQVRAVYASVMRSMVRAGYGPFEGIGEHKGRCDLSEAIDSYDQWEEVRPVEQLESSYPLYNLSDSEMSLLIDPCGYGTPLGMFEAKGVEVRAFGPAMGALGSMNQWGTCRLVDWEDEGRVEEGQEVRFRGWTRLMEDKGPSGVFAHLDCVKAGSELSMKLRLAENDLVQKIFYLFFVCADSAEVKLSGTYPPRSLKKFEGPCRPVTFKRGDEKLQFSGDMEDEMHLIPLEGESHFFGADYLLAYALGKPDGLFSWNVK